MLAARGASSVLVSLAINNARSGRLVSAGAHGRVVGCDVVYVAHRYVGSTYGTGGHSSIQ